MDIKLYKFRPLATCEDFCRAQEILKTGKFWCAKFNKLNDPMEGIYLSEGFSQERIKELLDSKAEFGICSFSKQYTKPKMWKHYASDFRGIVIEIEVNLKQVHKIRYDKSFSEIQEKIPAHKIKPVKYAKQILTRKLDIWKHESEYRYLTTKGEGNHEIGKITRLITWSNDSMNNAVDMICSSQAGEDYATYRDFLISMAKNLKVSHSSAELNDLGEITLINQD